jgi:hypothetical protein
MLRYSSIFTSARSYSPARAVIGPLTAEGPTSRVGPDLHVSEWRGFRTKQTRRRPLDPSFHQIGAELEGAVVLYGDDASDTGCLDGVIGHRDRHVGQEDNARLGLLVLKGAIHHL